MNSVFFRPNFHFCFLGVERDPVPAVRSGGDSSGLRHLPTHSTSPPTVGARPLVCCPSIHTPTPAPSCGLVPRIPSSSPRGHWIRRYPRRVVLPARSPQLPVHEPPPHPTQPEPDRVLRANTAWEVEVVQGRRLNLFRMPLPTCGLRLAGGFV